MTHNRYVNAPPPEPITEETKVMMLELMPYARSLAYSLWCKLSSFYSFDEIYSEVLHGLSQAAARWPAYCEENGYNSTIRSYFQTYCRRRMKGAVLDMQREDDPLSRTQRKALKDATPDDEYTPQTIPVLKSWTPNPEDPYNEVVDESPNTDPSTNVIFNDYIQTAVNTFDSFPTIQQELVAYAFLKDPKDPQLNAAQSGLAVEGFRLIIDSLNLAPPQTRPRQHYTHANPPPSYLVPVFRQALLEDPASLVELARRTHAAAQRAESRKGHALD